MLFSVGPSNPSSDAVGEAGKKLHTGRSRNDQVALDMRLYTRLEVLHVDELVKELLCTLLRIMEENKIEKTIKTPSLGLAVLPNLGLMICRPI